MKICFEILALAEAKGKVSYNNYQEHFFHLINTLVGVKPKSIGSQKVF